MLQGTKFFKVDLANDKDTVIPRDLHRDGIETDLVTQLHVMYESLTAYVEAKRDTFDAPRI